MKTAMKFYRQEQSIDYPTKVKTLDIKIPISGQDLGVEVRKAFDLAKSSGRELTVHFSGATADPALVYSHTSGQNLGSDCYS